MRIQFPEPSRRCSTAAAEAIGRKIEQWRIRSGCSRASLETIAGVSQEQVSRILGGKFRVVGDSVLQLCQHAGIDVERLVASDQRDTVRVRLVAELDRCWDGSRSHADLLIEQLRLTAKLRRQTKPRGTAGSGG